MIKHYRYSSNDTSPLYIHKHRNRNQSAEITFNSLVTMYLFVGLFLRHSITDNAPRFQVTTKVAR